MGNVDGFWKRLAQAAEAKAGISPPVDANESPEGYLNRFTRGFEVITFGAIPTPTPTPTPTPGSVAWTDVTGKPTEFTPASHNQAASTITDFAEAARAQVEAMLVKSTNIDITYQGAGATRQLLLASTAAGGGGSTTFVNVADHGIVGDGITDHRTAIQDRINALSTAGGGVLYFPPGLYMVSGGGTATGIEFRNNVTIMGAGPGATTIKLTDGQTTNLIAITGHINCCLRDLTVDGNRANQATAGSAVRSGGCTNFLITNVHIRNARAYGFGHQAGAAVGLTLAHVLIEDTGADGIDFKSKTNGNSNIKLIDVTVRRWGLNTTTSPQAAIDIRSAIQLSHIYVSEPGHADCNGVRFRQGELADTNGLGGHDSSMSDFDIRLAEGANQIGVTVVARNVSLSNGRVQDGVVGVVAQDSGFKAMQVRVSGAIDDAFRIDAAGNGLDADEAVLFSCEATGNGDNGVRVQTDNCQIIGFNATGNTGAGIRIEATAANTRISAGYRSGNTAGDLIDSGTGTVTDTAGGGGFTQGSYTPTPVAITNVSATVGDTFTWTRWGNEVLMRGRLTMDPAATGVFELGIPLPPGLASDFTNFHNLQGVAVTEGNSNAGSLTPDNTNNRILLKGSATSASNAAWGLIFSFTVK